MTTSGLHIPISMSARRSATASNQCWTNARIASASTRSGRLALAKRPCYRGVHQPVGHDLRHGAAHLRVAADQVTRLRLVRCQRVRDRLGDLLRRDSLGPVLLGLLAYCVDDLAV